MAKKINSELTEKSEKIMRSWFNVTFPALASLASLSSGIKIASHFKIDDNIGYYLLSVSRQLNIFENGNVRETLRNSLGEIVTSKVLIDVRTSFVCSDSESSNNKLNRSSIAAMLPTLKFFRLPSSRQIISFFNRLRGFASSMS